MSKSLIQNIIFANIVKLSIFAGKRIFGAIKISENATSYIGANKLAKILAKIVN